MGEEAGNGHLVGGTAAVGGDNSRMSLCKGWPLCWESRKAPVAGSHFRGADLSRALAQTNQSPALPFTPRVTQGRSLSLSDPHFLNCRMERIIVPASKDLCEDSGVNTGRHFVRCRHKVTG